MSKKYTNFRVCLDGLETRECWYALTTQFNYENNVVERLIDMNKNTNDIIKDVFTPAVERLVKKVTKKGEKIKKEKENLLPNYVFIKTTLTNDVYRLVMNTTGVLGLMCMNGYPSEITEKDIENIKSKMSVASISEVAS